MVTWIDRLLRRNNATAAQATALKVAPARAETELDRLKRLQGRMRLSVSRLPPSRLREVTSQSLSILTQRVEKMEASSGNLPQAR